MRSATATAEQQTVAPRSAETAPRPAPITAVLMGVVRAYRLLLSPWLGNQCRFEPTCSRYALAALEAHGGWRGSWLSARRIVRCNPWCAGGHDPVPPAGPLPSAFQPFTTLIASAAQAVPASPSTEPASDKSP